MKVSNAVSLSGDSQNIFSIDKIMPEVGNKHRKIYIYIYIYIMGARGGVMVKALRHKPAGRGFDSRWCHWNFSVASSFRLHYGPGVDPASNRNEYQVYFLGVKTAGA